jgi:Amidohydrolase
MRPYQTCSLKSSYISKHFNHFTVPLLGVNPWKLAEDSNHAYADFIESTLKRGIFKGIKLYPQIGYSVTGEIDDQHFPCRNKPIPTQRQIMDAMATIISIVKRTPGQSPGAVVMAHTIFSKGATRDSKHLGGPQFWKELIKRHPDLKVNLGHIGGEENLLGWNTEFLKMMNEQANAVHGDVGHWHTLMRPQAVSEMLSKLTPLQKKRLMYGTDWFMTSKEPWVEGYLSTLYRNFQAALGHDDSTLHDIFYGNAARLFSVG